MWEGYKQVSDDVMLQKFDTKFDKKIREIAEPISQLPSDKNSSTRLQKLIGIEKHGETNKLDWAMGELLAYGSLLKRRFDVRILDKTWSVEHFHTVMLLLKVEDSEEEVIFR